MIQLSTLGTFGLHDGDGRDLGPVLTRPKRLALLTYLAVEGAGAYLRRDAVLALFWPESDAEHAQKALRNALYFLRQHLGGHVLRRRNNGDLGVDASKLVSDVQLFRSAIESSDYRTAAGLYKGRFLHALSIRDAPDFERWIDATQADLQGKCADALMALAHDQEQSGNPGQAVVWWHRLVDLDPYDTRFAIGFTTALARSGQPARALRHADDHAAVLMHDLGLDPQKEFLRLVQRIREGRLSDPIAAGDDARVAHLGTSHGSLPPSAVPRAVPLQASATPDVGFDELAAPARDTVPKVSEWTYGRRWSDRIVFAVVVLVALIVTGVALEPGLFGRQVTLRPDRVVVTPFANQTGDSSLGALGRFAAEWIAQGLHDTPTIEAVPSNFVARILGYIERRTADGDAVDPIQVLARETGAGLVVMGSYYMIRDSLHAQVQITNAETGELVSAPAPAVAPRDAPDHLVWELRSRVMGGLAFRIQRNEVDHEFLGADLPSWKAFQEADVGFQAFFSGRFVEAIPHLEQAATMDSGQLGSWALNLVAMAERDLGTDAGDGDTVRLAKADSVLSVLDARRASLPAYQVHFLDHTKALVRGDYVSALRPAREAATQYPRSLWPFSAGYVANFGRRPREALYWFESVDPDAPAVGNWPFYWTHYWLTYHHVGDYDRQLDVARRVLQRYPTARRWQWEIMPLSAAGQRDAVFTLLNDAGQSGLQPYVNGALTAWREFRAHGYPNHAEAVLTQALTRYRDSPEDAKSGDLHRRLLEAQGRWADARRIAKQLGPGPRFTDTLNHRGAMAVLDARLGNRDAALKASRALQDLDSPYMLGRGTIWRARIAAVLGQREEAIAYLEDAFDEGYWFSPVMHVDRAFEALRQDPVFQDVVSPKDGDWERPRGGREGLLLVALGLGMAIAGLAWYVARRGSTLGPS